LGMIDQVDIHMSLDCLLSTDFSKFVLPLYEKRQRCKQALADLRSQGLLGTTAYIETHRDDTFGKLLMNNAYGKLAQDPARYKEHYLTDPGFGKPIKYRSPAEKPPAEWLKSIYEMGQPDGDQFLVPYYECAQFDMWAKPAPGFRYRNVGTAASITGAVRSVLMRALTKAVQPIYCDTDSIIALDLPGVELSKTALGAWDIEDHFSEVVIAGKKSYGARYAQPKRQSDGSLATFKIRSKGTQEPSWDQLLHMLQGGVVHMVNRAPTITKWGDQHYIERCIRATALAA
jgi:hypothetical protein